MSDAERFRLCEPLRLRCHVCKEEHVYGGFNDNSVSARRGGVGEPAVLALEDAPLTSQPWPNLHVRITFRTACFVPPASTAATRHAKPSFPSHQYKSKSSFRCAPSLQSSTRAG